MANMSYCRFRNTLLDLNDCLSALQEIIDNDGVNQYGKKLDFEERRAASNMYDACQEFISLYEEMEEIEKENKED